VRGAAATGGIAGAAVATLGSDVGALGGGAVEPHAKRKNARGAARTIHVRGTHKEASAGVQRKWWR